MSAKVCIAVEAGATDKHKINVGYYRCKASKQEVLAAEMPAVFSPFADGAILKQLKPDTAAIKVRDIRRDTMLASVGTCPACKTEHFISKADVNELVQDGDDLHCTLCSTEYTPVIASDVLEELSLASDDDEDEDDGDDNTIEAADGDGDDDDEDDDEDEDNSVEASGNDEEDGEENKTVANETETVPETTDESKPAAEIVEKPAEIVATETKPTETEDVTNSSETVTASTKEFVIDCLASAGDLTKQKLTLVSVNPNLALVLANDLPVLRLLANKAGDNATLFNDNSVLAKAFAAVLPTGDFSSLGGEPITYTVDVDQQIAQKVQAQVTAATQDLAQAKTTASEEVMAAMAIAGSIINKNFENTVNPIRTQLIDALIKRNMQPQAAQMVADDVLENSAADYNTLMCAKTEELMSKPLNERNTIGRFVHKSAYLKPTNSGPTPNTEIKAALAKQLTSGSVVISTAGDHDNNDTALNNKTTPITASGSDVDYYRDLMFGRKR